MATNPAEMKLSPSAAAPLSGAAFADIDNETTQPTQSGNTWTFEQWLEALAQGECDCETLIRGVGDSIDENPDACWELLALVDQYYRRHRITDADFHNLNLLGQALLLETMPNEGARPAKAAPEKAAPATAGQPPAPPPRVSVSGAPAVTKATVAVNDILRNRYRIDGILGRGGMGTVYAATDLYRPDYIPSDQRIALKVLHTEVVRRPGLLTELRGEFQCLQSLSHPNIIRVHEFDQDGDISFFTMEQLTGAPLGRVLAEQQSETLHRPYALAIIQQAGAALAYAHSRGIVHGDLNPGNIFITEWGEIRVLDFGAAQRTSRIQSIEAANEAAFRTSVATPSYASCDQLEGKEPTTEDDVYAMACITYVLLAGEHPFQGRNALAARQARQTPRRPAGISGGQWRALKAGLSFDLKDRPADMKAWLQRFDLPSVPLLLPSLSTISSARPRPRRVGPPVLTALIALAAGLCWWAQDQYGWLKTSGADTAIKATATAVHSAIGENIPSVAGQAPALPTPPPPKVAPAVQAQALPAPEAPASRKPAQVSPAAAAPATAGYRESARIELTASTVEVPPMQPVASVPVSRRHNYHEEVSFTWSTESGTAKPGQDFMPVKSRTEYIAAGAPQTRLLVPIVQNPRRHLSRTFYVVVNTPGDGATLGARTITQVTIPASD
jgi:serine/threonine protein kinase